MRQNKDNSNVVQSPYLPREQFYDFHARWQRFAIMVCHRRMGKTVACINDVVDKAIQNPLQMPRYSYVAPLHKQAKDIAWKYLKFYAAPLIVKIMESELSVELTNGAVIRLYGADNPDALRGVYNDGVIMDEYGDMNPRVFSEIIAPTLVDRKGWVVFIGTPRGQNHFWSLWNEAANDPNWFTQMSSAQSTGIIDADELEMMRKLPGTDDNTFRQEYGCDFTAANRGSYYGSIIAELEASDHMRPIKWDPNLPVITGWDIGITDDCSIWFAQRSGVGNEIAIIDFYTDNGLSVDDVLDIMEEKPYTYAPFLLPHDAKSRSFQTGKTTREIMNERGARNIIVPNVGVQNGIQAVRKTLPQIWFNSDCPDVMVGINALKMYQREWDNENKIFKKQPKHDWSSNPADAFRMLCLGLNPAMARSQREPTNRQAPSADKAAVSNIMTLEALFEERQRALAQRGRRI